METEFARNKLERKAVELRTKAATKEAELEHALDSDLKNKKSQLEDLQTQINRLKNESQKVTSARDRTTKEPIVFGLYSHRSNAEKAF